MRFHMTRAKNYDGNRLQYWNGIRVCAVFYTTEMAHGRSFTKRTVIAD